MYDEHTPIGQRKTITILKAPTVEMPILARRFSVTNFCIATSALAFQVFVLYPWHNKLDDDFAELKRENLRLMQRIEGKFPAAHTKTPAS